MTIVQCHMQVAEMQQKRGSHASTVAFDQVFALGGWDANAFLVHRLPLSCFSSRRPSSDEAPLSLCFALRNLCMQAHRLWALV